jgi:hypothetical protein
MELSRWRVFGGRLADQIGYMALQVIDHLRRQRRVQDTLGTTGARGGIQIGICGNLY